jgi:hypothetical protein
MQKLRKIPRFVKKIDNRIIFENKVNAQSHREYMGMINYCLKDGYDHIVYDFSQVINGYPNGMVPIITTTDLLKRKGIKITVRMPRDIDTFRLFLTTNWAFLLCPDKFREEKTKHNRHLKTVRYFDSTTQQNIVNEILDVLLRSMKLERSVFTGLEWSINEITDNVLNHSNSKDGGICQVSTFPSNNSVSFSVADSGVGILSTLQPSMPSLFNDIQALGEAVKSGVTRDSDIGQGNGLAGTLRIATMSGGSFSITSGKGHLNYFQDIPRRINRKYYEYFQGTLVCADIKVNSPEFSINEALGFDEKKADSPVDFIELNFESDNSSLISFSIKDESTGFGNRHSGRQLRTKVTNLLDYTKEVPLILNWEGIPLISSSFADEFIGKLFLELGAMAFSARIRNIGMEKIIRNLLDKAVSQRLTQSLDDFD